jgi:hypothetical protein
MKSLRLTTPLAAFLLSFFFSVAQTKQASIETIAEKLKRKNYVGLTVQAFYNDFRSFVKKPTWSDEPPGKLRGAYFTLNKASGSFLEIYFKVNPDSVSFNEHRNWTIKSIESSKITYVALLKGDSIILKFPR